MAAQALREDSVSWAAPGAAAARSAEAKASTAAAGLGVPGAGP